jgi:hypothetical protein
MSWGTEGPGLHTRGLRRLWTVMARNGQWGFPKAMGVSQSNRK